MRFYKYDYWPSDPGAPVFYVVIVEPSLVAHIRRYKGRVEITQVHMDGELCRELSGCTSRRISEEDVPGALRLWIERQEKQLAEFGEWCKTLRRKYARKKRGARRG